MIINVKVIDVLHKQITFKHIFAAGTGLEILRFFEPGNPQWQFRDHQFGRITYYVREEYIPLLRDNKVEFWVTNI